MPREGRDLEVLVATLEKALSGRDVKISSPYYTKDKDTGQTREADVAIEARAGSARLLIILECRDRSAVQDVRWIEELDSKRRSMGADKAIAVSPVGFTAPALRKASALGIETRELKELSASDISDWCSATEIEVMKPHAIVRDMVLEVLELPEPRSGLEKYLEAMKSSPSDTPMFTHVGTREIVSRLEIWKRSSRQHMPEWWDIPTDGKPVRKELPILFPDPQDRFCVHFDGKDWPIMRIRFVADLSLTSVAYPFSKITSYVGTDPSVEFATAVEAKLEVEGKPARMTLVRTGSAQAKSQKPGRNDPCPCGSSKKYKRCHGAI